MGIYLRGKSWYVDFWYEHKRYVEKISPVSKTLAMEKFNVLRSEAIRGNGNPRPLRFRLTSSRNNIWNFPGPTRKQARR